MQHRIRVLRAPALTSLLALGVSACSSEYPVGNLGGQSQPVELAPGTGSVGSADFQLDPLLSPADVSLEVRAGNPVNPAGVGDVDGDGYGDFAVTGFDPTALINYVHLRYGGPAPSEAEDQFALAESGARLAFEENSPAIESLGPAGDINGDGFADVLVTATICDALLPGGGAYVLYGGPERLDGVVRIGEAATHLKLPLEAGAQLACSTFTGAPNPLGDIDGDGFDDLMLMQRRLQVDAEPTDTRGYLFYGREERLTSETTWLDADAVLTAEGTLALLPLGDVTADGRADFVLEGELDYWVPGSAERLSDELAIEASFPALACSNTDCLAPTVARAGDVDGDGIDDLLAYETFTRAHLFYGAAGLLDGGVIDFEAAAASFSDDLASPTERLLAPAGDRDGDGDTDLLSLFYSDADFLHTDVAFVSGSGTRLAGAQPLPIQDAIAARPGGLPFSLVIEHQNHTFEQDRIVFSATDAGDLNGDGADDLLTTSMYLLGADEASRSVGAPQIHIHYGTPGGAAPAPVR